MPIRVLPPFFFPFFLARFCYYCLCSSYRLPIVNSTSTIIILNSTILTAIYTYLLSTNIFLNGTVKNKTILSINILNEFIKMLPEVEINRRSKRMNINHEISTLIFFNIKKTIVQMIVNH